MKKLVVLLITMGILAIPLPGCSSDGSSLGSFDGKDYKGWKLSKDATYKIAPLKRFSEGDRGPGYAATGEMRELYSYDNGKLSAARYFSAMETESYWRGLFFTSKDMDAPDGQMISADITPKAGFIAGICAAADENLSNGFAAVLNLAKERVEVMRINNGILTPLDDKQDGLTFSAGLVLKDTYRLGISVSADKGNFQIRVLLDGTQVINQAIPAQGIPEGHGTRAGLVASDMDCDFANMTIDQKSLTLDDQVTANCENVRILDGTFKGELTSDSFTINKRYITFRLGGGDSENLRVSLVSEKDGKTLLSETGSGSDEMTRRVWDVETYKGTSCRIVISDKSVSGYLLADRFRQSDFLPADSTYSLLYSQTGYNLSAEKKAYLRAPEGTKNPADASFKLYDAVGNAAFDGRIETLPDCWESGWWLLDFSSLKKPGTYVIAIGGDMDIISEPFSVGDTAMGDSSLTTVALDQLDLRRTKGKLGWRDSSTDGLRELHAQIMTVHTMLDLLEYKSDSLSAYNKARTLDNVRFGLEYILAAQERTDNPLTDGRFIHDLYPSEYTAEHLRSWFDITYALSALARAIPVLEAPLPDIAKRAKSAFELSYAMCLRRPFYLPEEFDVEGPGGLQGIESSVRKIYELRQMNWSFPQVQGGYALRTRDRLMWMKACTEMYKATGGTNYLDKAKELAKTISDRQFTDYKNAIDGAYGCFYEFDNSTEAIMPEWIQAFNLMLGNQTPTDMQPFIDLLEALPGDPDAAMWYGTVQTYMEGYVKKTAALTPLGIYPISATNAEKGRGVHFFQPISHGAMSHYGLAARNIMALSRFFGDTALYGLAVNNAQFPVGLNPGVPVSTAHNQWRATSFLYLVGSRWFRGYFGGGAYIPPIGSGFNGFSASTQFTLKGVSEDEDRPLGILDDQGQLQFNEDYIPHGMGYASGVAAIEAPSVFEINISDGGQPVEAQIDISGGESRSLKTEKNGKAVLKGVSCGSEITISVSYGGHTITRTRTVISGKNAPLSIDFKSALTGQITAPAVLKKDGKAMLTLTNDGTADVTAEIIISLHNAKSSGSTSPITIAKERSTEIEIPLSAEKTAPYLVYAFIRTPNGSFSLTAGGLAD